MSHFKEGDKVLWVSSGKKKQGSIFCIIPAGQHPCALDYIDGARGRVKEIKSLEPCLLSHFDPLIHSISPLGGGYSRDHDSYIVAIKGKTKTFLYWPNVKLLKED